MPTGTAAERRNRNLAFALHPLVLRRGMQAAQRNVLAQTLANLEPAILAGCYRRSGGAECSFAALPATRASNSARAERNDRGDRRLDVEEDAGTLFARQSPGQTGCGEQAAAQEVD